MANKMVLPPHFSKIDDLKAQLAAPGFADFSPPNRIREVEGGKTENRLILPKKRGKKFEIQRSLGCGMKESRENQVRSRTSMLRAGRLGVTHPREKGISRYYPTHFRGK